MKTKNIWFNICVSWSARRMQKKTSFWGVPSVVAPIFVFPPVCWDDGGSLKFALTLWDQWRAAAGPERRGQCLWFIHRVLLSPWTMCFLLLCFACNIQWLFSHDDGWQGQKTEYFLERACIYKVYTNELVCILKPCDLFLHDYDVLHASVPSWTSLSFEVKVFFFTSCEVEIELATWVQLFQTWSML